MNLELFKFCFIRFHCKCIYIPRVYCFISGETSAGKSTLINKIIGEKILVRDPFQTTTKIYRIKHSDTYQLKMYQRDVAEPTVQKFKNSARLQKKLEEMETERTKNPSIHQVDVMIPFTRLQVIEWKRTRTISHKHPHTDARTHARVHATQRTHTPPPTPPHTHTPLGMLQALDILKI